MKNILILVFIVLVLIGCVGKEYIPLTVIKMVDNVRIYSKNKIMSVTAPNNRGEPFIGREHLNKDFLSLTKVVRGEMFEQVLIKHSYMDIFDSHQYLNKKNLDNFEKNIKDGKNIVYYNKENGRKYYKAAIDYVDGVKCRTFISDEYSRKSDEYKITIITQPYETYCSFYGLGVAGFERTIHISYEYSYSFESEVFKNNYNKKSKSEILKNIQNQFKQDIKEIFDSLVIHDMDRERMKKEGLLYDKKYEINAEEKVKNNTGL